MSPRNGVDAQKLAYSLGTSVRVINQTYYAQQTEKEIDEVEATVIDPDWRKGEFDPILGRRIYDPE